jgi:hypothetical protein
MLPHFYGDKPSSRQTVEEEAEEYIVLELSDNQTLERLAQQWGASYFVLDG